VGLPEMRRDEEEEFGVAKSPKMNYSSRKKAKDKGVLSEMGNVDQAIRARWLGEHGSAIPGGGATLPHRSTCDPQKIEGRQIGVIIRGPGEQNSIQRSCGERLKIPKKASDLSP